MLSKMIVGMILWVSCQSFHDEGSTGNIETEEKDDEYCINQDDESEDVNQNDNGKILSFC